MNAPKTLNGYPVIASALRKNKTDLMMVMVKRDTDYQPYVVASWNENCGTEWVWGHYFDHIAVAAGYFADMTGEPQWNEGRDAA